MQATLGSPRLGLQSEPANEGHPQFDKKTPPSNAKYNQRISSPTTATSSRQDIQAHGGQSDGDITATIRPLGTANVGPTNAVEPRSRPICRPHIPPPGPARHRRVPIATVVAPRPTGGRPLSGGGPYQTGAPPKYLEPSPRAGTQSTRCGPGRLDLGRGWAFPK